MQFVWGFGDLIEVDVFVEFVLFVGVLVIEICGYDVVVVDFVYGVVFGKDDVFFVFGCFDDFVFVYVGVVVFVVYELQDGGLIVVFVVFDYEEFGFEFCFGVVGFFLEDVFEWFYVGLGVDGFV